MPTYKSNALVKQKTISFPMTKTNRNRQEYIGRNDEQRIKKGVSPCNTIYRVPSKMQSMEEVELVFEFYSYFGKHNYLRKINVCMQILFVYTYKLYK